MPNTLFVTYTNDAYFSYVLNLYESCKMWGIYDKLLMFCMDDESYVKCERLGIRCFKYKVCDVDSSFITYGTTMFNRLCYVKFEILYHLMRLGFDVLYTDSDIVFLTDILKRMQTIIEAD